MRLQVGPVRAAARTLAWAALLWSGSASSDGRVGALVSVYASNDHLTVVSPQASLRVPIRQNVDLETGYEADVISSATADVITAASPRGYTEVRHGATAGASYRPAPGTTLGARWLPSWEPDYVSQTFSGGASREWLDRRLTTDVGYRLSLDQVGRHGEPRDRWRSLTSHAVTLGLGWVLSPRSVVSVAYELIRADGFQASPYRTVRIGGGPLGAPYGVPEAVPDGRTRHALAATFRHALGRGFFAMASYRLYSDSWGVASHTEEVELSRSFHGDRYLVAIDARTYGQGRASFYAGHYHPAPGTLPELRSADKMLAPSWSWLAGPRFEVGLGDAGAVRDVRLSTKAELFEQRFSDFEPLPMRRAVILSLGGAGEF